MTEIKISTVHGGKGLDILTVVLLDGSGWIVAVPARGIVVGSDIPSLDEALVIATEYLTKLLGATSDGVGVDIEAVRKIISADGWFESGPFAGLSLTSVLSAFGDSSWDYPSAMGRITEILGLTKDWEDKEGWPMRPTPVEMYFELRGVCPDITDWEDAPIGWDT